MKKTIAVILSLCLVFATCASAFAADDQGLEAAVSAVRAVVDIPAEYDEFNYRTIQNDTGYIWALDWSGDNGRVYVRINNDGEILSYSENRYNDDGGAWAQITSDEAKQMAVDFAKKVDSELFDSLVFVKQIGSGRNVGFEFAESKNNVKLYNRYVNVYVDRVSKRVVSYSSNGISKKAADGTDKIIERSEAIKALGDKIGAELIYKKKYDYKEKKVSTYPAYVLNESYYKAISALDGSVVEYEYGEGADSDFGRENTKNDFSEAKADSANGGGLSKAELAAVENVSGLIDKQKAQQIIAGAFKKAADLKLDTAELYKDMYSDEYVWSIYLKSTDDSSYKGARANVDAKTGEILSYNQWGEDDVSSALANEAAAKAAAVKFLNENAGKRMEQCFELKGENENRKAENSNKEPYYFYADRKANGVRVEGEGIRIEIAADASVASYDMNITDSLTFDDISGVMDEKQAGEKFAQQANMELIYVYIKAADKYTPVYDLENKYISLNPFNGEIIENIAYGEAQTAPAAYTDIDNHWAADIIKALLDNGYFIAGSEFEPDKAITVKEFLTYAKFMYRTDDDEEIKAYIENVEPEKKAADLGIDINSVLTRETAAKYFTYDSGNYDIARYSEIFKYPFADSGSVSKENIGFIAICGAKKIFSGDENGNFNPQKTMTRAEAAAAIYNYYSAK